TLAPTGWLCAGMSTPLPSRCTLSHRLSACALVMPAPPEPAEALEIQLDSQDLIPEPEERSTSQTRRLGTNVKASAELEVKTDRIPSVPDARAEAKPHGKPYLSGDVIDEKYRLTRIIGRGGMGAVWQAHNIPLDIDVAIKLIRRDRTAPEAAERL